MVSTQLDFRVFQQAVVQQFETMTPYPLFATVCDKDLLWQHYLGAFPVGTNPIFRKRQEYDCSCCRYFIKHVGHVVGIKAGKLVSIWDDLSIPDGHPFKVVADKMASYVRKLNIENIFLHPEAHLGVVRNAQMTDGGTLTFDHFHLTLPSHCVKKQGIDTVLGDKRTTLELIQKGTEKITLDALNTVVDLIGQNSLYRGAENLTNVMEYRRMVQTAQNLSTRAKELYLWSLLATTNAGLLRLKNTSIGELLMALSEGEDLDVAVGKYEAMVAPTNYKRPTALVTKAMIERAKQQIAELGLAGALERRYATVNDVMVGNVLYVDRNTKRHLKGSVLEDLEPTKGTKIHDLKKMESMSIEKFIKDVLPGTTKLDVLVENTHAPNFVSLIAPTDMEAKPLFKWPNNFSWSYAGEAADSIKERVKRAGGNLTGEVRCSLSWSNYDDLDLHMKEPNGEICFLNRRRISRSGGMLDVDMNAGSGTTRQPVENIVYARKSTMDPGAYTLFVHQYCKRESTGVGFAVEVEIDGVVTTLGYESSLQTGQRVVVGEFTYSKSAGLSFFAKLPSTTTSKIVWNLATQQFHPVSLLSLSPNYWDGAEVGAKHYFFMLDGCRREGSARGLYNEFLTSEFNQHRKVMELIGSKVKTDESDHQLSGLGFTAARGASVVCRVSGSFNRQILITF